MQRAEDAEKYRYESKRIKIKIAYKIRCAIKGFLGRKSMLKIFCQKNKIDYPVNPGKKYALPPKFRIEHNEIVYIAKVRDNTILYHHELYAKKQHMIDSAILEIKNKISENNTLLSTETSKINNFEKELKDEKSSQRRIWLQSEIALVKTGISNVENDIGRDESLCGILEKTKKENIESWKKQIDLIKAAEDLQNREFVLNLTKKIVNKLGFKEFNYIEIEPSDSVKKILNGEYNNAI